MSLLRIFKSSGCYCHWTISDGIFVIRLSGWLFSTTWRLDTVEISRNVFDWLNCFYEVLISTPFCIPVLLASSILLITRSHHVNWLSSHFVCPQIIGIICMALASPAYLSGTHFFLFVVTTTFIGTLIWIFVYLLGIREALNLPINWILTVSFLSNHYFVLLTPRLSMFYFRARKNEFKI